jgi:hypothetical protein
MNPHLQALEKREQAANKIILESFCMTYFEQTFIQEIKSVVSDDIHLNESEIKSRSWRSIHAVNNRGDIDTEKNALISWWNLHQIYPIYATSRQRIADHNCGQVLVMKLEHLDKMVLTQINLGMWMFGDIPELAALRVSDWRADIWFSDPLRFVVLAEHDGYGTTTIAGPPELIENIKASATHGLYEWKDGVLPDWNKGAAFPETRVPPEKRTNPSASN